MYDILIVDDEVIERDGIKMLIQKNNLPLNVAEAGNGKQALEYLNSNKVHILFTDIVMPFVDGLELSYLAKKLYPDLKIIIYSAYGEFEYARKAMEAQVVQYILKPIDVNEFKRVMDNVISMCADDEDRSMSRDKLEKGYRKAVAYEKEKILIEMVYGEYPDRDPKDSFSLEDLSLEGKLLQMALLDFDSKFFDTGSKAFEDFLAEVLNTEYCYLNLNERQSIIFFVSGDEAYTRLQLYDFWCKINTYIANNTGLRFFTVFSDVLHKTEDIHKEYDRMEQLLEYKFFLDKSSVFFTEDEGYSLEDSSGSMDYILEKINASIDMNEYYSLEKSMELLTGYFKARSNMSTIYIKYVFADILKRVLEKNNACSVQKLMDNVDCIFKCSSIAELKITIQSVLESINSLPAENSDESGRWIIDSVVGIIEREYMNDIGLEYIAAKVNITPSYLSFLFRKVTGQNIVKYINQFRMEKSRKLLSESNDRIVDICKKVGFSNHSYFCLLFKNHFGVTPGDYKERVKKSEKYDAIV